MRIAVFSVMGLFMMWGAAMAQPKPGDEAALKAIEDKWDAASLKGDAEALGTIFAEGFITTNPEGKVRNKAEVLNEVKSGSIKYEAAKVDDLKISVYGDTAIVNGRWKGKFVEKGKTVDTTERFTDTFVRQNGQWKCIASHASTIK